MQDFNSLRKRARDRRDKQLKQARDEYAEILARIAELEQDLLGIQPVKHKSIASCIEAVIPTDRTFTTADIMAGLEAIDSGRVWRKRSVDNHLSRLRERGIVKRLKRVRGGQLATYAVADLDTPPVPFEGMELTDCVSLILRDSGEPMRATEVVVALLEHGYETSMDRENLRNAVCAALRDGGEFEKLEGGRWSVAAYPTH